MKRLILSILVLFVVLFGYGQNTPVKVVRIENAITAFGSNISVGDQVYNITTNELWIAKTGVPGTATLTTASADFNLVNAATTADIAASTDRNYITNAQQTIINNTSGTNTGDETNASIQTKLGVASGSADGYLSSANWNTFNNKGDMTLAGVQSVTGLKTFDKDKVAIKGTSTGVTTLSTANTSATTYTITLPAASGTVALTSDITSGTATDFSGSLSGDVTGTQGATVIAAKAVTLAKMNDMASGSLIYRKSASTGAPEVQTLATLKTDLGLTGTNSGNVTIGTANGLTIAGQAVSMGLASTSTTGSLSSTDWNTFNNKSNTNGTVTSVDISVPTGLSVSGGPVTSTGTLALSFTAGFSIPTTTNQTNWGTAYTDRLKWDGGATGLVAATGRTSLGATTVGANLFTSTNPTAIRFLRANADNTVSWLDASAFRTAIGAGTSSTNGTVTTVSVVTANGISGMVATATTTPAITISLGAITPSSVAASGDVSATRYLTTMPAAIGAAGTTTVDLSTGNVFTLNVASNITTLTLNNAPTQPATFVFKLSYSSNTAYTIVWPAAFRWSGGIPPVLTCTLDKTDILSIIFDGTNYYCSYGLDF